MSAPTRRRFLMLTGVVAGGLELGFACTPAPDAAPDAPEPAPADPSFREVDAYVAIAPDGQVELRVPEAEMGQGILTGLAMVLADELEVPWDRVRARMPDADLRYGRQGTGGSTSTRGSHDALRAAAAAVRTMLVSAAAAQWGVDPSACTARDGEVAHPEHGSLDYGALAEAASALEPPADPVVKPASERRLTGRATDRLDLPNKVVGRTVFGLDVRLPELVYARVARPPGFGGKVTSFDDAGARAVRGVIDVVQVPSGVAVVAAHTWAAEQGRAALKLEVDPGPHAALDDAAVRAACIEVIDRGEVANERGEVGGVLATRRMIEAEYVVPYLAHATMEPMNCTAQVRGEQVEVWAPTQGPTSARGAAAEAAGVDPAQVTVHSTFMGGGFGRRSKPDYVAEAVHVAKALGGRPVQVSWSREDDTRGGWYRPVSVNRLRGPCPHAYLVAPAPRRRSWPAWAAAMASTAPRSRARRTCPTPSRTCA